MRRWLNGGLSGTACLFLWVGCMPPIYPVPDPPDPPDPIYNPPGVTLVAGTELLHSVAGAYPEVPAAGGAGIEPRQFHQEHDARECEEQPEEANGERPAL